MSSNPSVAGAISLQNNDDDNTINKGRYPVKQNAKWTRAVFE